MNPARRIAAAALYVVPGVAIAFACALLLFGRARSGIAARIYGGPPGPDGFGFWRIVAVERSFAIESPLRGASLELTTGEPGNEVTLQGVTDDEGAWEARVALGTGARTVRVQVRTKGPRSSVVASARIPSHPPSWQASLRLDPLPVPAQASGPLAISVSPARGLLASPYPEELVVLVRADQQPAAGAVVTAQGQGLSFEGPEHATTDQRGIAKLRVRPTEHDVHLKLQARRSPAEHGEWSATLPVAPGGLWIEPAASAEGRVLIQSPVGHHHAYVTVVTSSARLASQRVTLRPDKGGAFGAAQIEAPPPDAWILVSPDPPGRETNAIGWPVPAVDGSPRASAELRTPLLVDGVPMAEQQVRRQSMRTRVRALGVLGLAAALEAVLLWWRAKQERLAAEAALAHQPDLDDALRRSLTSGKAFWLRMVLASAIIALGFFSVALISWIGTR